MEARRRLGQLLDGAYYNGHTYVIERAGGPMAAVVPLKFLEKYQESKERLSGFVKRAQARNKGISPRVLELEVREDIRAVRARKPR